MDETTNKVEVQVSEAEVEVKPEPKKRGPKPKVVEPAVTEPVAAIEEGEPETQPEPKAEVEKKPEPVVVKVADIKPIEKSYALKTAIAIYKTPNKSAFLTNYIGALTCTTKESGNFVEVSFVMSGLGGKAYGFVLKDELLRKGSRDGRH